MPIYLSIDRCPKHPEFWAVCVAELDEHGDGSGTRITPSKCCGSWERVREWKLSAHDVTVALEAFKLNEVRELDRLRTRLANTLIERSIATGHGDTAKDLLDVFVVEFDHLRAEVERLRAAAKRVTCQHEGRTGGNDYIYCEDCGLAWDYRRTTASEEGLKQLRAALAPAAAGAEEK